MGLGLALGPFDDQVFARHQGSDANTTASESRAEGSRAALAPGDATECLLGQRLGQLGLVTGCALSTANAQRREVGGRMNRRRRREAAASSGPHETRPRLRRRCRRVQRQAGCRVSLGTLQHQQRHLPLGPIPHVVGDLGCAAAECGPRSTLAAGTDPCPPAHASSGSPPSGSRPPGSWPSCPPSPCTADERRASACPA